MAKKIDLRTYLALEKAFVRRLQRSWRIQSAPLYQQITQHCIDHQWDKARQLVPLLDMAEVGTENREWITYMLLSFAVFGAGTVAKKKPSFVGVGSFDTFLKQVTNNILMYLEYSGTAQVQREALQSIAEDEAKTKAIKWDEAKHPRDKEGQFASSAGFNAEERARLANPPPIEGGYGPARAEWEKRNRAVIDADDRLFDARLAQRELTDRLVKKYTVQGQMMWGQLETDDQTQLAEANTAVRRALLEQTEAEAALKRIEPTMRKEVVTNLANDVAEKMGIDPKVIRVVDKEPAGFEVGGKNFTEAGHYDPATRQIEINSRNLSYGDAPAVKGIVAHEISHLIYHTLKREAEREFQDYLSKAVSPGGDHHTQWYHERFAMQGEVTRRMELKPEYQAEFEAAYPASAVLAKLSGGHFFTGIATKMIEEDGHSAYAESYWTPEARAARGHSYESAINETIAEITRYITHPQSWDEKEKPYPYSPWVLLTKAMHEWYRERQDLIEAQRQAAIYAGQFR